MIRFFCALAFLAAAASAAAQPIQDTQKLRQLGNTWLEQQAAANWPGVRARAETAAVDAHLRLAACAAPRFSLPQGARLGSGGSIQAQCQAPARWSLYLGYQLRLSGPALVARRDLPARSIVAATDLEVRDIAYEQPPTSYPVDVHLVAGSRTSRPIAAGQPLLADALSRPPIINAGQHVSVVAHGTGFSVRHEGSALNTAATGEPVRVKLRSGRMVQGVAQEDGSVLVQP